MKFFFNDRHILLADAGSPLLPYRLVDSFKDTDSLKEFVNAFVNDEMLPDACIVAEDFDMLKSAFLSLFPIVNAAGGLIHDGDDEYLVIDRKGVPDLPKGKAEEGEGPIETAMREVEEETGLQGMNVIDLVEETYHTYRINDALAIKRTVWFSMSVPGRPKLIPQIEEQITCARWVSREDMRKEAEKTYKSLRDIFLSVYND